MAIAIIGNVGNVGYALPMVSSVPLDTTKQYLLGWDPANQALNYFPMTLDVSGNLTLVGNLVLAGTLVGSSAGANSLAGSLAVGTTLTVVQPLTVGPAATPANQVQLSPGATPVLNIGNGQVVTKRQTGWTVGTGTPQKSTFATGTVTLAQLAGVVLSLQTDLITHGLIGP